MNAMTQIAQTLQTMTKTPEERRREKNRRYYERNAERWVWYAQIQRLRSLAKLLGVANAHH